MEKINIAELLKDCPSGMELDCVMYEDVYFDYVDKLNIIHCYIQHETHKTSLTFNQYGTPNSDIKSKCIIFPKGKTTWEGCQRPFVDGDVIYFITKNDNEYIFIFKNNTDIYIETYVDFTIITSKCSLDTSFYNDNIKYQRLATEEEKQKLFNAIKANGYRWNAETKTLEKLVEPKFKVGDRITDKNKFIYRITEITDKGYKLHDLKTTFITFEEADSYFVKVVDVFDITNLKPFDKVLTRANDDDSWVCNLYSHRIKDYYVVLNAELAPQCIPYEGNEHLIGTTNDCDEFYKTWE